MKRTAFNVIVSILLILISLVGIAAGAFGGLEVYAINEVKNGLGKALEPVDKLDDAIQLLEDNEETYLDGVEACYEGDEMILQGRQQIANGKYVIYDSRSKMADAQAQYDEAVARLNEAKAEYAVAEAKMEETRPAYEEGRAALDKLEQLQSYVDTYAKFKSGYLDKIPGFASVDAWFVAVVIPAAASRGVYLPSDINEFAASMDAQIAEANALLAEYAEAEKQLDAAKAEIDEAERQLAEAKAQLDEGYSVIDNSASELAYAESRLEDAAAQLEEGKASLEEYQDVINTVSETILTCFEMPSICKRNGDVIIKGVAARFDEDFDIYLRNDEGNILALQNGEPRLDYDKCRQVTQAFKYYIEDYEQDLGREAVLRGILSAGILIVSLLGIFAAISALRGKEKAHKRAKRLLALAALLNIYGMVIGYLNFTHPQDEEVLQGILPVLGLWLLTIGAIVFVLTVKKGCRLAAAEELERMKNAPAEPASEEENEAAYAAAFSGVFGTSPEASKPAAPEAEAEPEPEPEPEQEKAQEEPAEEGSSVDSARKDYEEALRKYYELKNKK